MLLRYGGPSTFARPSPTDAAMARLQEKLSSTDLQVNSLIAEREALKAELAEALRQRDEATQACTGDLANMRARVEALTAERDEFRRELELYRAGLIEWKHRAEAAEAEAEQVKADAEQWRAYQERGGLDMGRPTSSQAEAKELRAKLESAYSVLDRTQEQLNAAESENTRLRAALDGADCEHREGPGIKGCRVDSPCWRCRAEAAEAKVERYRAALEIAAKDTSWEYVHKVAGEALSYSVPALPIDHEAEDSSLCDLCSEPNPTLTVCDSCWDEQDAENVAKARAEALEEAARIAEGVTIATNCECTGSPCSHDQIHNDTVEAIASAIRAAKGGEG